MGNMKGYLTQMMRHRSGRRKQRDKSKKQEADWLQSEKENAVSVSASVSNPAARQKFVNSDVSSIIKGMVPENIDKKG